MSSRRIRRSRGSEPPDMAGQHAALRQALRRRAPVRVALESGTPLERGVIDRVRERLTAIAGMEVSVEVRPGFRRGAGAALLIGADTRVELEPGRSTLASLDRLAGVGAPGAPATLDETVRLLQDTIASPAP